MKVKYVHYYCSLDSEHDVDVIFSNNKWIICKINDDSDFQNKEIVLKNGMEYGKHSKPYFELIKE